MHATKLKLTVTIPFLALAPSAFAQGMEWSSVHPRPLQEAASFLQEKYHQPVTYEDPLWRWLGDSVAVGTDPAGPYGRLLWGRNLSLPAGLTQQEGVKLDVALVQKILDAYQDQNQSETRYKVLKTPYGLHIVPVFAHNENGALVETGSLLDTRITVAPSSRLPSEHLTAICQAITNSSGIKIVNGGMWFDQFFAPNDLVPQRFAESLSKEEKAPYSFVWGASDMVARDALTDLLARSATTLPWALLCQPSLEPKNWDCVLNLRSLHVVEAGVRKSLIYDRCGKCEFLDRPKRLR